jgi:hypothetical protein
VQDFLNELTDLLSRLSQTVTEFLLAGDINLHLDDENNADTKAFNEIMDNLNLVQYITCPTHVGGHTLDVVIGLRESSLLNSQSVEVLDPG